MIEDDIILEIRATRERFAAAHGYDIHAMFETLRALDAKGDRVVVDLSERRPVDVTPATAAPAAGAADTPVSPAAP